MQSQSPFRAASPLRRGNGVSVRSSSKDAARRRAVHTLVRRPLAGVCTDRRQLTRLQRAQWDSTPGSEGFSCAQSKNGNSWPQSPLRFFPRPLSSWRLVFSLSSLRGALLRVPSAITRGIRPQATQVRLPLLSRFPRYCLLRFLSLFSHQSLRRTRSSVCPRFCPLTSPFCFLPPFRRRVSDPPPSPAGTVFGRCRFRRRYPLTSFLSARSSPVVLSRSLALLVLASARQILLSRLPFVVSPLELAHIRALRPRRSTSSRAVVSLARLALTGLGTDRHARQQR